MNKRKAGPVTMRALIQRINRKLEQNDQRLRVARGSDLGRYYILDFKHNSVVKRHVDPEALGRDFGVLKDYELLVGSWSYPNT